MRALSQRPSVLAVALAAAFPSLAFAQPLAKALDRIVVTGSRTPQTQDAALASITVLERADIERLQAQSLLSLLRGVPGLAFSNSGGPGKVDALFIRGTEARHVLLLIDGVRVGSATSGTPALQDLPLEQIERVEIVRGPFSSLYGSDAVGGVIQIFTREARGEPRASGYVGAGSYGTARGSAGLDARGERGWYRLNAAIDETDGFNACRGSNRGGCFTNEPDADGYTNRSLQLAGGWRFSPAAALELRGLRADFETESDGSFSNEMEGSQQVYGAKLDLKPSDRLALALRLGHNADLADNFLEGRYRNSFDTKRDSGGLQADASLGRGLLSAGFDWHRDEVASTTDYVVKARTQKALFAQWQQTLGEASLQLAGRRDDDSQFGNETTGSLLWGWNFREGLRLTASAGTAFRAPSFNDLYFPGFGNPNLAPETSESLELGLRGSPTWGGWALALFRTDVDQLIAFDPVEFIPVNINRARIDGLELSADGEIAATRLRASATVLDARNVSTGSAYGNALPRRPPRSAQVEADRSYGRFSLGATVFAASARYDDLGNFTRLPGYATVDLRVGWALSPDWSLQLSGNNLFDRRYETAAFYNQPGRSWMLGLRYSPR